MTKKTTLTATLTAAALMLLAGHGFAQTAPSLNLSGAPGLLDMPSGEAMPDGNLSVGYSRFGPISRNTLSFQITPRLSGTFRYVGIRNWNDTIDPADRKGANKFKTYYDRNFDARFLVLRESTYLPAVSIGLQDFIGTSLSMGEYVVATKTILPGLKLTGGVGFGRLGSYHPIGQPLGSRPRVDFDQGGSVNASQWFHGNAALFGGLEYRINDKLTFKAEYSSDAYRVEAAQRDTFDRASPFNFGIDYRFGPRLSVGASYMYGSEVGINLAIALDVAQRPQGGIGGPGALPIKPRPSRASNPAAYATAWLGEADVKEQLIRTLTSNLERTGIKVEQLSVTGDTAQVRFRNTIYDASAQSVGRMARAMSATMPASVETFELVPVVYGMPTTKVTLRRSDLESLEFAPDAGALLYRRTGFASTGDPLPSVAANPELYPKFNWSIGPYTQTLLFNPNRPFQYNLGVSLRATYEIAPGLVASAGVIKRVAGNMRQMPVVLDAEVPPVRSNAAAYNSAGDPALSNLTLAWYGKLAPDVYGRVTAGYLEQMYGGVSAEVLWRPVSSRLSLGAEVNYVAQRNVDGGLGFDQFDYRVLMGNVSAGYDLGKGYEARLDVGRYLAGDYGGTFTFTRVFDNGWKVGAFATLTNLSAEQFGEGSFDKGIRLDIPVSWFVGQPTRNISPFTLRPVGRDGGAQLNVNDRLRSVLRGYDQKGLDGQWERVWK